MMILFAALFMLVACDIEGLRCRVDEDCKRLNNFCNGVYVCNLSARCDKEYVNYDPCMALRETALAFNREYRQEHTVSILCLEEIDACVEVYYCTQDADCDDSLYCNGKERCIHGQCKEAEGSSVLCDPCDERTRCGVVAADMLLKGVAFGDVVGDDGEEASPAIVYTVLVIFTIVGSLIVFILLAYIFNWVSILLDG